MSIIEGWRAVPGWEGEYEVSDLGRVRSVERYVTRGDSKQLVRERILRAGLTRGYRLVTLSRQGSVKAYGVHTLVAAAFIGPRPAGMQVAHGDGDRTNNALANLRYATQAENEADKKRHGTCPQLNKTHCPRGHEYTPENTRILRTSRICKACALIHKRESRARAKAARTP